jgi:hypothetical protein
VAGEAEIGLLTPEEVSGERCPVHSMAIVAAHSAEAVSPSPELEKGLLLLMTLEAGFGPGFGISVFEGEDQFRLPSCVDVPITRAMAGFASFSIRRKLCVERKFPVGVLFFEGVVEISMTGLTHLGHDRF